MSAWKIINLVIESKLKAESALKVFRWGQQKLTH